MVRQLSDDAKMLHDRASFVAKNPCVARAGRTVPIPTPMDVKVCALLTGLFGLCAFCVPDALGESVARRVGLATPSAQPTPPTALEEKALALKRAVEARQRRSDFDAPALNAELRQAELPESRADEFVGLLERIGSSYDAAAGAFGAADTAARQLVEERSKPALPKTEAAIEELREEASRLFEEAQGADSQVQLDEATLGRLDQLLAAASQEKRRIEEEADSAAPGAQQRRASLDLRFASLREEAAAAASYAFRARVEAARAEGRAIRQRADTLAKVLHDAGLDTAFNTSRARAAADRARKSREAAGEQLDAMRNVRRDLDEMLATLTKDLDAARAGGSAGPQTEPAQRRIDVAAESRGVSDRIVRDQEGICSALDAGAEIWTTVLAASGNFATTELQSARSQARRILEEGVPWLERLQRDLQDIRNRMDTLRTGPPSRDAGLRKLEEQRAALLDQRTAQLQGMISKIDGMLSSARGIEAESAAFLGRQSFPEKFQLAAAAAGSAISAAWNTEVFTTGETILARDGTTTTRVRGVTIGKVLLAILLLGGGILASRSLAETLVRRAGNALAVDPVRGAFLEKLAFTVFAAFVVLGTLNWLRIPLTAFAFLGGALAIGAGFGAQTLMNNFISGLILLAERRIRVGDIIEADGHLGRVATLGTRCSRVLRFDGVDVLVPNSCLLEKNVINWTLSNPHHRFDFPVGINYGSEVPAALALFERVLKEQSGVLGDPAPAVYFEAFGDDALVFRLYFWIDVRSHDSRVVGSGLRVRIDAECRKAGIEMAFPQRDVHLHTAGPLSIEMSRPAKA